MSMFRITQNKGFQMTFENGCTISVQFGYRNYCDNYDNHPDGYDFSNGKTMVESSDAEIAIMLPNGEFYDFGNDLVKGYCSADEVADYIKLAKEI
jgi:hypothetical protein